MCQIIEVSEKSGASKTRISKAIENRLRFGIIKEKANKQVFI